MAIAVGVGTTPGIYRCSSCHDFSAKAELSIFLPAQNALHDVSKTSQVTPRRRDLALSSLRLLDFFCRHDNRSNSMIHREDFRHRVRRGARQGVVIMPKKNFFQQTSVRADDSNANLQQRSTEEVDRRRTQHHEIRICINKTCRRSGSLETLDIIRSLAPPSVTVQSCGCLGSCGVGPNLVILPVEMIVNHCNTAAHAARLLALQCGAENPDVNLKALALKQQANKEFELGNYPKAEKLYSEAIDLNPSGGLHFIYANRSALRLALGEFKAALEDAEEAAKIAPQWPQAFLRQADAFSAMGEIQAALSALKTALHFDPSLRRSKSYQVKSRDLESKLALLIANA
ncbi:unnamed protein product [Sphagnum balticum]